MGKSTLFNALLEKPRAIVTEEPGTTRDVVSEELVLNGLPRHVGQARDLDPIVRVSRVVLLECSAEVVAARIARDTGGDRAERIDDHGDLVARKLATYEERTLPLVTHYEDAGARVDHIPVGVDDTPDRLLPLL